MKYLLKHFKTCLLVAVVSVTLSSCEEFLNRPDKSAYTVASFYKTDAQLLQAANILYNSPWHDFTRGFIGVGDVQAGNHRQTGSFWNLNHTGAESVLSDMSASLWSVNARANTTLESIDRYAPFGNATEQGIKTAKGEILVWKAMAYFYLVRIYGAVPIVHDNSAMVAAESYNNVYRVKVENVYDYIIMALEKAIEWLPEKNQPGRIDRYTAYGLLAKVYLTKSGYGQTGSRNTEDLAKAEEYAGQVVNNSGRVLMEEYSDIFRGSNNFSDEALLSWHWTVKDNAYTAANYFQAELAITGFDEFNCWGSYNGPSVDLQNAFGEDASRLTRNNADKRRKATMMMYGDVYEYFWRDHPEVDGVEFPNGFDYTKYLTEVAGQFYSPTGANVVKLLVGNNADHQAELGMPMPAQMSAGNSTHILRLADVYLIYAEAILGNSASTSDSKALAAFNAVRTRSVNDPKTSITFDDIMLERRLELAYEGDNWFDFVRLAYYNPGDALERLKAQERKSWIGLDGKDGYLMKGVEGIIQGSDGKDIPRINDEENTGKDSWTVDVFNIPFPETDLQMNPNLLQDPVDFNFETEGVSF